MRKPFNHDPPSVTKARENAGLTKTALASRLGCSLSLISEIESGTRNAQPPLLEAMAKVLEVPVSKLRRRDEPEGKAAASADVAVPVRDVERPSRPTEDLPELRDARVVTGQRQGTG